MKALKSSDRQHLARVCCTRAGQVLGLALWAYQALATPVAVTEMPTPLTAVAGDPVQGLRIAQGREGQCALCHGLPGSNVRQGNLGPGLDGVAKRLTPAMLRLRLVDSRQINPDSLMPAYHSTAGLQQVGKAWTGQPVLPAQDIEDVLAYLLTLN
jgi:sulfur-oxidizing protein SoxX